MFSFLYLWRIHRKDAAVDGIWENAKLTLWQVIEVWHEDLESLATW